MPTSEVRLLQSCDPRGPSQGANAVAEGEYFHQSKEAE